MDVTFGARLRLQRERQQIALVDISERTKIKLSLLEGLENDDVSQWPKGIFRRSYIRAYAQAIGLDPDVAVREFLELHPDTTEDIPAVLAEARGESANRRPPMRLRFLIDSAINALPALGLQFAQRGLTPAHALSANAPAVPAVSGHEQRHSTIEPAIDVANDRQVRSEGSLPVTENDDRAHRLASDDEVPVSREPLRLELDPAPVPSTPAAVSAAPARDAARYVPDLSAMAYLCTRLSCVMELRDVTAVFADAARVLDAVGMTVWMPDPQGMLLAPVLSHGYSDEVLAQMSRLSCDTENPMTAAFRTGMTGVVNGGDRRTGAVIAPLLTPSGCAGVLALELRAGAERNECVRAAATILAAQLSTLLATSAIPHTLSA